MGAPPKLPLFDEFGNPLHGEARDKARKLYWYSQNPDKYKAIRSREYAKNKSKRLRYWRDRYFANPDFAEFKKQFSKKYYRENKDRISKAGLEYRKAHRMEARARTKEWIKNNPHKARAHSSLAKAKRKARILEICKNPMEVLSFYVECKTSRALFCFYCGKAIASKPMHMDHILALVNGGSHSVANLAPSCPDCNLTKNDLLVNEWFGDRPLFYEI